MNAREENAVETTDSSFRISSSPVVDSKENRDRRGRSFCRSTALLRAIDRLRHGARSENAFRLLGHRLAASFRRRRAGRSQSLSAPSGRRRRRDKPDRVEPMSKNCEVNVEPGSSYRVEMGYFDQTQTWRCVGTSEIVQTPTDKMGALSPGDFALVPFHITFQRLTELFRATRIDEGSLVQSLTRLQEKSLHPEEYGSLAPEEREVYRAMKASVSERTYLPRVPMNRVDEMRLQKKLESVLGFGARPSSSSLGGSSKV